MWCYDLLESYGEDERITRLVDHVRNIIIPVMIPDGYNFSRKALTDANTSANVPTGAAYRRKNRRADSGSELPIVDWNPETYGVDPNRNHAFGWGGAGWSASTLSDTHRATRRCPNRTAATSRTSCAPSTCRP